MSQNNRECGASTTPACGLSGTRPQSQNNRECGASTTMTPRAKNFEKTLSQNNRECGASTTYKKALTVLKDDRLRTTANAALLQHEDEEKFEAMEKVSEQPRMRRFYNRRQNIWSTITTSLRTTANAALLQQD